MSASRSFLERSLSRFTNLLQESVFAEEAAAQQGWLQHMDPRVKVAGFLFLVLAASFSHSMMVIVAIYLFSLILAGGSHLFSVSFLRRVWIFMPFYTAFIAVPALFLTPGEPLIFVFSPRLTITEQGARTAGFLILRVATSVSYMFLMVLTTSWPKLLKAFRSLGFPKLLVFLLAMTHRYIYVLLNTANALFMARKSRKVGPESWQSTRHWIGAILGALLAKSYHLSNEVYLAMQSRGFRGEPVILTDFRMRPSDFLWLILLFAFALVSLYFGYWRGV